MPSPPPTRFFYGYVIMGLAFIAQLFSTGLVFYAFGVFVRPIHDEMGWSMAETAFGFSLFNVASAFYNPLLGRGLERWGPKPFLVMGCLFTGLGLMAISYIQNLWQFYLIIFFVVGWGGTAMGGLSVGTALVNWFERKRSFAIAVSSSGVSLGGVMVSFLGGWMILESGWRVSMRVLGISVIIIVLPPMLRWMVNRPEEMGLAPDGDDAETAANKPPQPNDRPWTTRQLLGTLDYWKFVLAFAVSIASLTGVLVFLIKSLVDYGYTPQVATRTFGLTAAMGFVAKPALGILGDRLNKRWVIAAALALQTIALGLLMKGPSPTDLYLFSFLFGLGMSANLPIFFAWMADRFGRVSFAKAMGMIIPFGVALQSAGHYYGGRLYDLSGNWDQTWNLFLFGYLLTLGCIMILPRPRIVGETGVEKNR